MSEHPVTEGSPGIDVENLHELHKLVSRGPNSSIPRASRLHLTFLAVGEPRRSRLEAELDRYIRVCGCGMATVGILVFGGILAWSHFVAGIRIPLPAFWAYSACAIAAAGVGGFAKLLAIQYAKWRMGRVYQGASALQGKL